ncbi:hypothetical protein GTA08_BOTSDO02532 [Neofusicoccum parvum]|nr:hypothetical protein GTA08_BOTSDO02532 [Neofusicoccum parvum]
MATTPQEKAALSSLPRVYDHTANPETTLLPHLRPHLPNSIPIYRRIQFGFRSPHTHILATVPIEDDGATAETPAPTNGEGQHRCLAAAYIDRSRRPETECWIHLSWDAPSHRAPSCACSAHLLALLHAAAALPYPPLTPEQEEDIWRAVRATGAADAAARFHAHTAAPAAAYLERLDEPALLKVGTMHERGVEWVRGRGWLERGDRGKVFLYRKYVFDGMGVAAAAAGETPGEGLRWGRVREEDLALARSRTAIPRTDRTLRVLPSVAVFPEGGKQPVAWAFLGVDGSLSGLHVEPEYRGRGLAKAMGRKLFREGWGAFGDELNGLAHADVALENSESNGVCRSLGGVDDRWHVAWVRIDLDGVREAVDASQ